jgi:sucrose phosphorylase
VLDTHDGIGVIDVGADSDDSPGLLDPPEIDELVETIHRSSQGESKRATGGAANNLDLYQVNCTYLDALGRDETRYLIARAIQFFVPGIPQIYYVGLLGGTNDMGLLASSGVGRDINRHYYSPQEVASSLKSPMIQRLIELIRIRNSHEAFEGECSVESTAKQLLSIAWKHNNHRISLKVDLSQPSATIEYSLDGNDRCATMHIN